MDGPHDGIEPLEIFKKLDQNGDGKVTFQEFVTGCSDLDNLLVDDFLKAAFSSIDRDGNGFITKEELQWRFSSSDLQGRADSDVTPAFWEKLIRDIDRDMDDQISIEEFMAEMKRLLIQNPGQDNAVTDQPVGSPIDFNMSSLVPDN